MTAEAIDEALQVRVSGVRAEAVELEIDVSVVGGWRNRCYRWWRRRADGSSRLCSQLRPRWQIRRRW